MEKIFITDMFGTKKEVNFITIITLEKYNSSYLVYSENEITDDANLIVFGKISEKNGEMYLDSVPQEEKIDLQNEFRK